MFGDGRGLDNLVIQSSMIIDRNLSLYIINEQESIQIALVKIDKNQQGFILVVDEEGRLTGLTTDGDIRRWLVAQKTIDLSQPIANIMNRQINKAYITQNLKTIENQFSKEIKFIPLIDDGGHLVGVAKLRQDFISIQERIIGGEAPVFIIAEIGNNHNGSFELAKQLVDSAIEAGADCIKFQMRDLGSLYVNKGTSTDNREDLGSQYTLDLLNRFNLKPEEAFELFDYCKEKGVLPLCTPWDLKSLERLESYGMPAYKVASADLTNHELLAAVAKTGKPLICSTGMTTEDEIRSAVNLLNQYGAQFALLHCNSTYPAPFKDINLRYLGVLKEIGNCPVGYSGHERGGNVAVAAVSLGAKIIEKHLTLDRSMEGNDHRASLLPQEFKAMVNGIREAELALGNGRKTFLSQGEMLNREVLGKSLIINCDLDKGQIIKEEMVDIKSPGKGLPAYRKQDVIGRMAQRIFKRGDFIYPADIAENDIIRRRFEIKRLWGIPVRYHDFQSICDGCNMGLVEFHLSYRDLEEETTEHLRNNFNIQFTVHAPEIFAGDHLLDLASDDENYRKISIENLQKVVDVAKKMKPYFKSDKPLVIVHVGGATQYGILSFDEKQKRYKILAESLKKIKADGVEIVPETMPPFPWHFGGQQYHNLFVDPDEVVKFCQEQKLRVCLDVAHSKLACNHYKWSFKEFIEKVGPYAAHYHVSDARGVDGEGLQIQEGEIDFASLAEDINRFSPRASLIPEIWQGHKDNGKGFWQALGRLEKWL